MPDHGRPRDVSGLTSRELENARRDLAVSMAMIRPGSPACIPIAAQISAIDRELARRHGAGQASDPR